MCILFTGQANQLKKIVLNTRGLLASMVDANPNGVGIMFAGDDGAPVANKILSDKESIVSLWLEKHLPDDQRQVAVHLRYATHGAPNSMDNCHPYEVDGGYLMHNGVLASGQGQDKTKSDTWHYCRWFLDGQADSVFGSEAGRRLLGHHIGSSNRFAYLDSRGQLHVVNKNTGVEYEGLWFSNTYAWDVEILDPTWTSYNTRYGSWTTSGDPRRAGAVTTYKGKSAKKSARVFTAEEIQDLTDEEFDQLAAEKATKVVEEIYDATNHEDDDEGFSAIAEVQYSWGDQHQSVAWLLDEEHLLPQALEDSGCDLVAALVYELGEPVMDPTVQDGTDNQYTDIALMVIDEDYDGLDYAINASPNDVAQALQYCLIWPGEQAEAADDAEGQECDELDDVPF